MVAAFALGMAVVLEGVGGGPVTMVAAVLVGASLAAVVTRRRVMTPPIVTKTGVDRSPEARGSRAALELARDGLWEWNLVAGRMTFSPRWVEISGSGGGLSNDPEEWLGRIHTEDRPRVRAAIADHLAGTTEQLDIEHRIQRTDGAWTKVRAVGKATRDGDGRAVRMTGWLQPAGNVEIEDEGKDSWTDILTGLPNRDGFLARVAGALARSHEDNTEVGLLLLDLDRFGALEHGLGHEGADEILKAVSRRLLTSLRGNDVLGRVGGDAFGILVESLESRSQATLLAERVSGELYRPFTVGGRQMYVAGSVGIVRSHDVAEDIDARTLFGCAERAMRKAKKSGGGRHAFYERSMWDRGVVRLDIEHDLRKALDRGELEMHYQPVVNLTSGRMHGVEALVRWRRADGSLEAPDRFIGMAEETGLIIPIGTFVLQQACSQMADWMRRGCMPEDAVMSVNLSATQFADPGLAREVGAVVSREGLDPGRLNLEITEGVTMADPDRAIKIMDKIQALGVTLSLDDFGTGYSSLGYLQRFPVSRLKIDRRFVAGLGQEPGDAAIAKSVVSLARAFELEVVAEGIETQQQWKYLRDMGCDYGQGFLFARALSVMELDVLFGRQPHEHGEWWDGLESALTAVRGIARSA